MLTRILIISGTLVLTIGALAAQADSLTCDATMPSSVDGEYGLIFSIHIHGSQATVQYAANYLTSPRSGRPYEYKYLPGQSGRSQCTVTADLEIDCGKNGGIATVSLAQGEYLPNSRVTRYSGEIIFPNAPPGGYDRTLIPSDELDLSCVRY